MVRCLDCGFCGFHVDLPPRGLRWYEITPLVRRAFEGEKEEYNPPGQSPGTGHWSYLRCGKSLHEWKRLFLDDFPSPDRLRETLANERNCLGFVQRQIGVSMDEYYRKNPRTGETVLEEFTYDVFLSHSSLDDNLAQAVKELLDKNGIKTFSTPESIPTGAWEPQIEEALQQSRDVWVLLTPNALGESVWVHHEFGYFHGFRHGKGEAPAGKGGDHCHYLYVSGTLRPGLYAWIMGADIPSFEDPAVVAGKIAEILGRNFQLPQGYESRRTPLLSPAPDPPELRLRQFSSQGQGSSKQTVTIELRSDRTIYNIDAVAISSQVSVRAAPILIQVPGGETRALTLDVSWTSAQAQGAITLPREVQDSKGRTFIMRERPRDPGEGDSLIVTLETDMATYGAVTYFRITRHSQGFPEFSLVAVGAPFGMIRGTAAIARLTDA